MGNFGTYCGTALVRYYSQVKYGQLGLASETVFNDFIGSLIPRAEKIIDSYCNHNFGTPSFGTFTLDGSGKSLLFFPPKWTPLIGLNAGSVDSSAVTIGNIKVYDQYVRYDGGNFAEGKQNVVFYGSYGYLDENRVPIVPPDVSHVCAQLCANVLMDMVRRRVLPDMFLKVGMTGDDTRITGYTLFAAPDIFTLGLQNSLNKYKITWVDIG